MRRAANTAAAVSGCICDREIVLHGAERVTVKHDDWCPMLNHGTQFVIYKPSGCDK
jgi:hypothetical protein